MDGDSACHRGAGRFARSTANGCNWADKVALARAFVTRAGEGWRRRLMRCGNLVLERAFVLPAAHSPAYPCPLPATLAGLGALWKYRGGGVPVPPGVARVRRGAGRVGIYGKVREGAGAENFVAGATKGMHKSGVTGVPRASLERWINRKFLWRGKAERDGGLLVYLLSSDSSPPATRSRTHTPSVWCGNSRVRITMGARSGRMNDTESNGMLSSLATTRNAITSAWTVPHDVARITCPHSLHPYSSVPHPVHDAMRPDAPPSGAPKTWMRSGPARVRPGAREGCEWYVRVGFCGTWWRQGGRKGRGSP
eukprot:gene9207-biopygen161